MDSIVNGSNALMTSDCKPHHSNISATLSQYDNQNVKFIKYVNKSKLGSNSFLSNSGLNGSRLKKNTRFLNQSSVIDGDDSQICEEAGINVGNIKTTHFNMRKATEEQFNTPNQSRTKQPQSSLIEE